MPTTLQRFAIITVIPEAEESVRQLFSLSQADKPTGRLYFTRTLPTREGAEVTVFSTSCRDRSNIPAAVTATELVVDLEPDCVLVVDIAGGIDPSAPKKSGAVTSLPSANAPQPGPITDGVRLGDVLVATYVQYYEFDKRAGGAIKERVFAIEEPSPHLLTLVNRIRTSPDASTWPTRIRTARPETSPGTPRVRTGEIMCGDKLLGDPDDPLLEKHLSRYDKAEAVDMESVGVARALYETRPRKRVEFLVIRGISDFCNREGNQATRDQWKKYACDAAASFCYELVSRAAQLSTSDELRTAYQEQIARKDADNPQLRHALPLTLSVQGRETRTEDAPSLYRTLAGIRRLLIYAPAGAGKTFAVERLASGSLADGGVPVFISAASSTTRLESRLKGYPQEDLDFLLAEALVPAKLSLLDSMPAGTQRCIIFDGLNELYAQASGHVVRALDWLVTNRIGYSVVVTDRGRRMSLATDWVQAELQRLDPIQIEQDIRALERDTGRTVGPEEQELLRTPFFLDWALKVRRADVSSPAQALAAFLEMHGELVKEKLADAARAAFSEYFLNRSRTLDLARFGGAVGEPVLDQLIRATIVVTDRGREGHFAHQLLHDYLASFHLARNEELWTDATFDAVSFGSRATVGVNTLTLVVEQLGDREAGDRFIRRIYDWNWVSAIRCTAEASSASPKRCTDEMEAAIVALVSEKLFDPVPNTREKARNSVAAFRSSAARDLTSSRSLDDLIQRLGTIQTQQPWFEEWRKLFAAKSANESIVLLVESEDPLVGWTASNVMRRSDIIDPIRDQLCSLLGKHGGATFHDRVVRWRIVHSLGRSTGARSVDTLVAAMESDEYMWVQYGAARSLVEVAVDTKDATLRKSALARMTEAARKLPENVRHEAGEVLLHDRRPDGWANLVLPFMRTALNACTDDLDRKRWEERIARLGAS